MNGRCSRAVAGLNRALATDNTKMAVYNIYAFCDCGQVHSQGVLIYLHDGPAEKQSIGDTFSGNELPPQLRGVPNRSVRCPVTGKAFYQKDPYKLFLVPTEG